MTTELNISPDERERGELTPEHVEAVARALRVDGFLVLNNVVDVEHLDYLHERLMFDLKALIAREDAPFNWNVGNIQQDPPPFPPYLFRDVLVNDVIIAATSVMLGRVRNLMYSGNTAMPSEHRQPVHADITHIWPRLEVAHPPVHLIVNVPTVDVSAENGSTELWPGTHRDTTIAAGKDIKIPHDVLEQRRAVAPPIQPSFRKGGVLIRDMRLWHAGMPNHTDTPRPMIAMLHVPQWLESGYPLTFPVGTEPFFQHRLLETRAKFVEETIDHINAPQSYEYAR